MINTSVVIYDGTGSIKAEAFRKLDLHTPMVEIEIQQDAQVWRGETLEEEVSLRFLLERKEAISFGHALVALGESL